MPGNTKILLHSLLKKHHEEHNVTVPFSRENAFLLDNESLRYLAMLKNDTHFDGEQTQWYSKSWNISVKECSRLIAYIITRPTYTVRHTFSLNDAKQLIRKLSRPIAETIKFIEENIQLCEQYKINVLKDLEIARYGIPQNVAIVVPLTHPRTACSGQNCCLVIEINNEKKVEYTSICHSLLIEENRNTQIVFGLFR
jgi:hypothetical protein